MRLVFLSESWDVVFLVSLTNLDYEPIDGHLCWASHIPWFHLLSDLNDRSVANAKLKHVKSLKL